MSVYQKFIESAGKSIEKSSKMQLTERTTSNLAGRQVSSSTPMLNKHQFRRLIERQAELKAKQEAKQQRDAYFKTDDPVLLRLLQAMRYEIELESIDQMQARSVAMDEFSRGALAVRNSQVTIQELRNESNLLLDLIDYLIERLPIQCSDLAELFVAEFSELWRRLYAQTSNQMSENQLRSHQKTSIDIISSSGVQSLTVVNGTPRKSRALAKDLRPLDELAISVRTLCVEIANRLHERIDNSLLESSLRKLKELYGRFVEISIQIECAEIVRALDYDFSQSSLNRLSQSSLASLQPVRPFESCGEQLPFKWALIALWQLTKDDTYICRVLTEQPVKWSASPSRPRKRLDYSTKYDTHSRAPKARSQYEQLYQICARQPQPQKQPSSGQENEVNRGAISNALKRDSPSQRMSTIELLIEVIISQPNKHERVDMLNFIHSRANKLVDLDELDQSVSAAIYTSNQYKVAALRVLNHLCAHDQAVRTILKCFFTPPTDSGQTECENKIIRSIFECYQTSQEHIYQNETMFHTMSQVRRNRKRCRQQVTRTRLTAEVEFESSEHSDYGSRLTAADSQQKTLTDQNCSSSTCSTLDQEEDQGDDIVVKEAIRLLVQLTTPFHQTNQALDYYNLIGGLSIKSLVMYLTNIIKSTTNREMLFLSLSALANISFITTDHIRLFGTNAIMLEMFRTSKNRSRDLELRDQAVTILANTADKNLLDILNNAGLSFLLSCLESCPTRMVNYKDTLERSKTSVDCNFILPRNIENKPRQRRPIDLGLDPPIELLGCTCDQSSANLTSTTTNSCLAKLSTDELAAMERIHQKTAVAFARMSADPKTIGLVLKYGGIKQMIDLCKFRHKRNYSDTVLIACIAALRKMARVIESDTFRYYNALDLIELELDRALRIYGGQLD